MQPPVRQSPLLRNTAPCLSPPSSSSTSIAESSAEDVAASPTCPAQRHYARRGKEQKEQTQVGKVKNVLPSLPGLRYKTQRCLSASSRLLQVAQSATFGRHRRHTRTHLEVAVNKAYGVPLTSMTIQSASCLHDVPHRACFDNLLQDDISRRQRSLIMQDAHRHPIAAAAYDVAHRQQGNVVVQNAAMLLDESHTVRSPSYMSGKDDYTMEEPSDVFGRVQLPSVQRLKMEVDAKELDRSQSPSYEAANILAKLRRDGPGATEKTAEQHTGSARNSPKEYHGWHPDATITSRPRARLHPYPRRLTAPSSTQYRGIQLPWPVPGLPQDARRSAVLLTPRRYLSSSPELHSSTRLTYSPMTYLTYGQPLQHSNEGYNGAFPGPLAYHQRSYNHQASSSPTQTSLEAKPTLGQATSTPVAYKSIETKPDLSSSLDNVSSWVTVRAELEKLLVPDDMHQHGVNGIDLDVFASMSTQQRNTDEQQGIRVLTSHFCATTGVWHSSADGLCNIADSISSNVVALHLAGINASCYSSIPASTSQAPQDPPARRIKLVSRTLAPTSSADVGNTNARLGVHRIALPLDATCDSWSSWCNTVHEAGHAALGVADPNKRCTYVSCISWHGSQWITLSDISKILKFRLECINFRVLDIKQLKECVYSALRTVRDADTCAVEQDSPLLQALNALGCLAMCRNQKIYRWHAVDHDKLFRNAHIKATSAARALTQPSLRMATAAVNKAATATTQSNRETSNPGMPALRGVHGKLMPMCLPVDVSW